MEDAVQLSKDDIALLQETMSMIESHHKHKADQLEEEVLRLKHSKAQCQLERNLWKARYLFLEESANTIIRNHQLELANRADQIELLTDGFKRHTQRSRSESSQVNSPETISPLPKPAEKHSTGHSTGESSAVLIHTREKQLERLATQLDNTNGSLQKQSLTLEQAINNAYEMESKNVELRHALEKEKLIAERLRRHALINEKATGFKKLLSVAALPMSIPTLSQNKMNDKTICQFLADLRAEVALVAEGPEHKEAFMKDGLEDASKELLEAPASKHDNDNHSPPSSTS